MTRDKFVELWDKAGLTNEHLDTLTSITTAITSHFYIINDTENEEILIIDRDSYIARNPVMFGWYKFLHIGRDLYIEAPDVTDEDLLDILTILKWDLEQ